MPTGDQQRYLCQVCRENARTTLNLGSEAAEWYRNQMYTEYAGPAEAAAADESRCSGARMVRVWDRGDAWTTRRQQMPRSSAHLTMRALCRCTEDSPVNPTMSNTATSPGGCYTVSPLGKAARVRAASLSNLFTCLHLWSRSVSSRSQPSMEASAAVPPRAHRFLASCCRLRRRSKACQDGGRH